MKKKYITAFLSVCSISMLIANSNVFAVQKADNGKTGTGGSGDVGVEFYAFQGNELEYQMNRYGITSSNGNQRTGKRYGVSGFKHYISVSGQNPNMCDNSRWYIVGWYKTNYFGAQNWRGGGDSNRVKNAIRAAASKASFISSEEINSAVAIANSNTWMICQAQLGKTPPPPKDECDPNNPGSVEATEKETRNYSNIPYAVYTMLSEVIPEDLTKNIHGEDLKKWKETHHAQDSNIIYTHAGEFLQKTKSELVSIMKEISKEKSLARWENYKKRLQAEIDKDNNDNTAKSPELQLDDKNKECLALGGAFTVTEKRSTQQISYNIDRRYKKTWGCVNINGTWKWATASNSQATSWLNAVDEAGWRYHKEDLSVDVQDNSDKPKLTKQAAKDWAVWRSWQFLNARCNKDEVEAIIRALGGGDNSVTTKEGSGTVYTPVVKRDIAKFL